MRKEGRCMYCSGMGKVVQDYCDECLLIAEYFVGIKMFCDKHYFKWESEE